MPNLSQDLRCAWCSLTQNPTVTLAVVIALALGIGANSVVFSVIDALLLRGVPGVANEHELVAVFSTGRAKAEKEPVLRKVAHADYLDFAETGVFSGLAAYSALELSLTHDGPSERVDALAVSDSYFDVLGVAPGRGRFFAPDDAETPVAVVSFSLWQRRFGGDPELTRRAIRLNGRPVTVVGVAPRDFRGASKTATYDVWVTLPTFRKITTGLYAHFHGAEDRQKAWLEVIGRRAPGVATEEVRGALETVAARLSEAYPDTNAERGVRVFELSEVSLGTGNRAKVARYSGLMLGLVACVLGVACLDVASLLLARSLRRRREIAIRSSLGAGQGRLVRQLLTESLVLAAAGGAAGLATAHLALPLVERWRLPVAVQLELALDPRVTAFALAVTALCGLGFGLAPALRSTRTDLVSALRGAPAGGRPGRGRRFRFELGEGLVAVQVALALIVVIGSGLMIRTLEALDGIEIGYRPENTLVASLDLASAGYEGAAVTAFYDELTARLRSLPRARSISTASALPMVGAETMVDLLVSIEGAPPRQEGEPPPSAFHAMVGEGYFRTVSMEILEGRDFTEQDTATSPAVVIVNETLARRFWPDRGPLGRRLSLVQTEEPYEVVGVVSDAKYGSLKEEPVPVLYLSHRQQEKSFLGPFLAPSMTLLLRSEGDARSLLPELRRAVQAVDPHLPVFRVTTLSELLSDAVAVERQMATLMSAFALLAVLLVMVGIYGVVSQAVGRRSKEIAVRVACGATAAAVLRSMLGRSLVLSLAGVVAGLGLATLASRAVAAYLYGVTPTDPALYAGLAIALIAATLAASWVPARHAVSLDPAVVLRED